MSEADKKTYYCPYCSEKLSFLEGNIVKMDGVLECETFSTRAQFFFPAELGKYGAIIAGQVKVRDGAKVEFYCINPRCNTNFTATYNHELAEIRMQDGAGRSFVVIFNKIYGRQATFVVDPTDKTLISQHGEHAESYAETFERPLNFFGAV